MFCPKCGKAEQSPETYCRQCGDYLPDYDKSAKKEITPLEHIKVNTVLNLLTAITSLTLAILLYSFFLGKEDTPVIIYITAGFLTAMTAWQVQTFWRTILLRKHFKKRKNDAANQSANQLEPQYVESKPTRELLNEADLSNIVPTSVTENTTKHLNKVRREK
ncbi:MAG: hypothetical protein ABJA66_16620 [Actinomycetota bacterium]